MADAQLLDGRRGLQPCSEARLATPRPCNGGQFEHAPAPEQIEVGRVGMMGVREAFTGLASTLPAMLQTADPAFVKQDGPPYALGITLDARLQPHKADKHGQRKNDRPCGSEPAHGEPDEYDGGQCD